MSTTTMAHAEAVDAQGKPLTPEPKLTDAEKTRNAQLLLAMIATDWVRGDKHHLVEIETLALALTDELGDDAAEVKQRLVERPAARAAGPSILAQKKAQAIVKVEAAVDAAKHGNAAAKEAAAAELRRAHAMPDAV